ncbi:hypothetical protein PF011_g3137 [Phytophthora fragariae]|uniref:FYVE-type domain-containing protein n=1 Tax=Phytophthora fragariae TaxID=53985 RepID=A0A6A3LZD3_9STRA|nr:hypothetical protein PF011_g3137 [Phytophthora fragariae]
MSQWFPIPCLPPLEVSELEHEASKQVMQQLLAHTLREFEFHSYHNSGIVDARRWKPHTYRDDIELYRERKTGVTGNSVLSSLRHCRVDLPLFSSTVETLASPTMLLTGYGQGRVEDAMSALVTESQHDLALAVKFKHQDVADCAILKTLEPPTRAEPYHYLGYKFFVRKSPTEGLLFKHRHSVYLEFSGITRSSKGEQLGFHIMHSVELPQFPDLSDFNSIRAVQSTRYIYRQKSTHVVEVFMLGNMDISGRIFRPLANMFTVDVFFGVTKLLELAEVRRLSQMARNQRDFGASTAAVLGGVSACTGCNRSDTNHKMPQCLLCGKTTCKKCAVTKRVFVGDDDGILGDFVKVPACRACVRRATTGGFVSPHERVLRTADDKLNFDFRKPKPTPKVWSKPAETQRHPSTRRETYPSASPSKQEPPPGEYSSSVPTASKLDQQESEDVVAPRLNRRWTKPTTTDKSYSDRGFRHVLAEPPARPRARTRVSIPAQGDAPIYGAPPRTRPSADPQIPSGMSPAERAIMTRLFELSKMAEDASATAQLNGIYCEQHWREELKMEVEASRSQGIKSLEWIGSRLGTTRARVANMYVRPV